MYPISYEVDPALGGRNRLTTLFRYLVSIPWLIVVGIYGFAAEICAVIAWFSIVFTGRYPEGLYDFNAGFLRMSSRTSAFQYLLTDEYPPFNGEEASNYPVRVGVPPALAEYDRMKTGLRIIYGIPVILLALVQSLILGVCALVGWFTIVFTGRLSEGLFNSMRSAATYLTRASGYFLLLTEESPPSSIGEGGTAPAGEISQEAASRRR
jgi:uncharacterized protein DUF4389